MSKKETITYSVICPFGKDHKFPVVLEVDVDLNQKKKKKVEGSSIEVFCPFCDKYVQVPIENLKPNEVVLRAIR